MKGNLLIIEDEIQLLRLLKLSLEDFADHVFTAINGEEALRILSTEKIHCVVSDINMPGLSGMDVIREIRSSDNDVPFIFYTGHGSPELMTEAAKYGALDFLDKPKLDGLEDGVKRGLMLGLDKNSVQPENNDNLSDYKKFLTTLKK